MVTLLVYLLLATTI